MEFAPPQSSSQIDVPAARGDSYAQHWACQSMMTTCDNVFNRSRQPAAESRMQSVNKSHVPASCAVSGSMTVEVKPAATRPVE